MRALLALLPATLIACGEKDDDALDGKDGETLSAAPPGVAADIEGWAVGSEGALPVAGAAALLAGLSGDDAGEAIWTGGRRSALTWRVRRVSAPIFGEAHAGEPALVQVVTDLRVVWAALTIQTPDGELDEEISLAIRFDRDDDDTLVGTFRTRLEPAGLGGALDLADHLDVSAYDAVHLRIEGVVLDGELSASIIATGELLVGDRTERELVDVAVLTALA